jgi:hypothetical protein
VRVWLRLKNGETDLRGSEYASSARAIWDGRWRWGEYSSISESGMASSVAGVC